MYAAEFVSRPVADDFQHPLVHPDMLACLFYRENSGYMYISQLCVTFLVFFFQFSSIVLGVVSLVMKY